MSPLKRIIAAGALTIAASMAACSDNSTGPSAAPGLRVVAGSGVTDTVNAALPRPIVIELRDANLAPIAGARVDFTSGLGTTRRCAVQEPAPCQRTMIVATPASGVTDQSGRVSVTATFNYVAGPAELVALAPDLQLADTARFVIRAGSLVRLEVAPVDTAVYVGAQYPLRIDATDAWLNQVETPPTMEVAGAAAINAGRVRAQAIGRSTISVGMGSLRATVSLSTVPAGNILFYTTPANSSHTATLYTAALDGSDVRPVVETATGRGYAATMVVSRLSPNAVVHDDHRLDHTKLLYVRNLQNGHSDRFLSGENRYAMEFYPRVSADGMWVYFSAGTFSTYSIYRARSDGSGVERVVPDDVGAEVWGASPSPTRAEVAFVAGHRESTGPLGIMSLPDRTVRMLGVRGLAPSWSPDGSAIAYIGEQQSTSENDRHLFVINRDGANNRVLVPGGTGFWSSVSWSPDGAYIVTSQGSRLVVVELATGVILPITWSINGWPADPVWR